MKSNLPIARRGTRLGRLDAIEVGAIIEGASRASSISVTGRASGRSFAGGMHIDVPPARGRVFIGKIVPKGPNDEDDYPDFRYWVERQAPTHEAPETAAYVDIQSRVVTATHLGEVLTESHILLPDTFVVVHTLAAIMDDSLPVFFFQTGAGGGALSSTYVKQTREYLTCTLINADGTDGETVSVLKPPLLRESFLESVVRNGVTVTMDAVDPSKATATDGTDTETWLVTLPYVPGDHLRLGPAPTGEVVNDAQGNLITLRDLNEDGRTWAQEPPPE